MKLAVQFENQNPQEFVFTKKSVSIGRSAQHDITINNASVSATHATISNTEKGFVLDDNDSTNGTFINNVKIKHHHLNDGDTITIGNQSIVFYSEGAQTNQHEAMEQREATVMVSADFQKQLQQELSKNKTASVPHSQHRPVNTEKQKKSGLRAKIKQLLGI